LLTSQHIHDSDITVSTPGHILLYLEASQYRQRRDLRTSWLDAPMKTCPLNSNLWHWPTGVSAIEVTFDLEHCRSDEWTLLPAGITVCRAQGCPMSFDIIVG
jgi:hypothetical protein